MEEENFNNINPIFKDGFAGDRRYFKGFLAKMELIFMLQPDKFEEDPIKVAYIISRLYGSAMNWAATLIENNDPCLNDYDAFISKIKATFGSYDSTFIANQKLKTIRQKRLGDVGSYIMEFNKYADESSWNEEAKMDAFLSGLNDQIATRILEMFPGPQSLFSMQTIASRIDCRLSTHRQFFNPQSRFNNNNSKNYNNSNKSKEPFSNTKQSTFRFREPLSNEEKERRRKENLCAYCGSKNHQVNNCPLKNKVNEDNNKPSSSNAFISNPEFKPKPRPRLSDDPSLNAPVVEFNLQTPNSSCNVKLLIDSGSQLNLMDIHFAKENNIPFDTNSTLPAVSGVAGNQTIFGKTFPITLKYKNHLCKTEFYIVDLPPYCGILGIDWLATHNPSINFTTKEIGFNSNYCLSNCLTLSNSFVANSKNKKSDKSSKPHSKNNHYIENPSVNKSSCNTSCSHSERTKSINSQHLKNNIKSTHASNSCVFPSKYSCNPVNLRKNSCNSVNFRKNSCNPVNPRKNSCNSVNPDNNLYNAVNLSNDSFNNNSCNNSKFSNQSVSSDIPNSGLKSNTQNQHTQYSNLSKPNNSIFSKESVNDDNKSKSNFCSKSNKHSTCQNFFLPNPKEIINNSSFFAISKSKSIKYKRKLNNKFKEFKTDAYLPYEDKPPENLPCYVVKNKSK